jgi:hypothetical protein
MKASIKFSVRRCTLLGALTHALCTPASNAVPLSYDEAVSGDLPSEFAPSPIVFHFDVGTNSVRGRIIEGPFGSDFDSFAFSIPTAAQLTEISYDFATTALGTTLTLAQQSIGLFEGNASPSALLASEPGVSLLGASPVSLFYAVLPLNAGLYQFVDGAHGFLEGESWLAAYQLSFNVGSVPAPVTGVPEPGTLALFGLGLAGFVLARGHA